MDNMRTIYLVPHTHYDVAWAFSKEDYLKINEEILEEALKIMKSSEFKFSLEQTFLLEAVEERNPKLWHKLKEKIKEGKLEIVDGQYLMPDTMLPAGEVLVREILFGKRYCKEKFGIDVPVAWAADSFGMNAQLPQIYKKAGYKWLAFRRGAKAEITQSEFLWKGLDGTTILAHWMPLGYRAGLNLDELDQSFVELNKYASTRNILMPCGSGSMPPQPEIPQAVDDWNKIHPDTRMLIATPSQFFQALEKSGKKFEVTEGELYDDELVDVFPQVCTSRIWIVQESRHYESLLTATEEFSTLASLLGAEYPTDELHRVWKEILFVAFHDIISGCGVDEIYGEVRQIFDSLKVELSDILTRSLVHIASKVNTGGEALVVFNPLPWRARNWVEADLELPQVWEGKPGIKDIDEVESQIIEVKRDERSGAKSARVGFTADLPPLGYKAYGIIPRGREPEEKITVDGEKIETPFFKVITDDGSGIVQILDKESGLLIQGNELFIDDEIGDLYHHRSRFADLIKSESGMGFQYGSFKPKSFKIEKGALKWKIVFENEYYCLTWPYRLKHRFPPRLYKYKTLDIHKEVILFRDIPRIEFITRIDNKYPNIRLSMKFDTGIHRKVYFRETQFGVIPEPTEYLTKREDAKPTGIPNFMSWFDLSDGIRGITFMNKGLPAVWIDSGSVYIRLLRSVSGLSADGIAGPLVPTQDALELKPYTFEYALQFHKGDWRQSEMYNKAQEFEHTPLCIQSNSKGDLPAGLSFLEISPNNFVLSALKRAEDSDEVVLRFFETKGVATKGEIKTFKQIKRATIVDLLEREEREIPAHGGQLNLEVNPFEIVTLKLQL
jgi:alpha-mannosidase